MAASQQVKDDFLAALTNYGNYLQAKIDAAESSKLTAAGSAAAANDALLQVNDFFNQTVTKAAEAVNSALLSYNWANKAEDSEVQPGLYSAYHHRRKAEVAAQQVLTTMAGVTVFKGQWNASGDTFPTGVSSGWMYRINAGGTLTFEDAGTKLVSIGDYILKTDTGWTYIDEATDAVKGSRTINGKALNVDIVLTPADIQAVALSDLADNAVALAGTDDSKWMSSLKVRQALGNLGIGLTTDRAIATNVDDLALPSGIYRAATATAGTFPRTGQKNGTFIVTRATSLVCSQMYIYTSNGDVYIRTSGGGVWSAWAAVTPAIYGIGADMRYGVADLNTYLTGGFYLTPNVDLVGLPSGWPQQVYAMFVMGGPNYAVQTIIDVDSTSGTGVARMATRRMRLGGSWSAWYETWTNNNLVKQASATDNTVGSVLLTGAGGLVVGNALDAGAALLNANDLINGTLHRYETTEAGAVGFNLPALGGVGTLQRHWQVSTYGISNRKQQEATEVFGLGTTKGRKFTRVFQDSTWSAWAESFTAATPVSSHSELSAKLDTLSLQIALAI